MRGSGAHQALDLAEARAWHAGDVNEPTIGVEIQNPVQAQEQVAVATARARREPGYVHGAKTYKHLDFYDIQMKRVVELAEVLCARFGLTLYASVSRSSVLAERRGARHD